MQIDIDFEVFKELTARRIAEGDTYNEVIRRLLGLPASDFLEVGPALEAEGQRGKSAGLGGEGVFYSNVFFSNGTRFRATYKGRTHHVSIKDGVWIDEYGIKRSSPSDAASSISKTNVNGWRFWYVNELLSDEWVRMDTLRR